jgi:hypothetical protein
MSELVNPYAEWLYMMLGVGAALPPDELADLQEWEKTHIQGDVGTSDWPGWAKYIGPKPQLSSPPPEPKAVIPQHLRWEVFERDNFTCQHCGSRRYLSVDHIVPESKGGLLEPANLQTLCRRCNSKKGAR